MNINTKYDVGHTFWVPRVRKRYKKVDLTYDGYLWVREVESYEPYVKLKRIVKITIQIDKKGTSLFYGVIDDDEDPTKDFLLQQYRENQILNYTESEAWYIARQYAGREKEYFGEW
jgi:hypothetical protein